MTPEATYSVLALLDRWHLMLTALAGGPLPELPDAVGRVHRLPWGEGRDEVREQWDAEHGDDGDQVRGPAHLIQADTEGGSTD